MVILLSVLLEFEANVLLALENNVTSALEKNVTSVDSIAIVTSAELL